MATVEISARAERDLRRIGPGPELDRIRGQLLRLETRGMTGADVKALEGRPGWIRVRVGDWRLLILRAGRGRWWLERVVHRSALERAVKGLG